VPHVVYIQHEKAKPLVIEIEKWWRTAKPEGTRWHRVTFTLDFGRFIDT